MSVRRPGGFSLMEMLVTLMLVSFATMLMFQMLGSYRIARERVQGQSGLIDRQALFQDWFRDSVHGLFIAEGLQFTGERTRFRGTTLNPMYAPEGSPTEVQWTIEDEGDRVSIAYVEDGRERWRVRLARADLAQFAYIDEAGKESPIWPPERGLRDARPSLPAVVVLSRTMGGREVLQASAVLGPLKPPVRLYGEEELK